EQREPGCLAKRQAAPIGIERPALLGRHEFERIEAVDHAAAQTVDAADHGRIGESGAQQAFGAGEDLRAGRARRGDAEAGTRDVERARYERAERMRLVHAAGALLSVHAAIGVELAVGALRLADARRRGAEDERYARLAVAFRRGRDAFAETVLGEPEPSQAMIARIPDFEPRWPAHIVDFGDATDPARQRFGSEIVAHETARARAERTGERLRTAAGGAGDGVRGNGQRRNAGRQAHERYRTAAQYRRPAAPIAIRAACYHVAMSDTAIRRVETFLTALQDRVCAALEVADGLARFREDAWQRVEGGGGRTRVLRDGAVFEQGGVNYSCVHGERMPPAATAHRPELAGRAWTALGVSLVLHPRNPYVPTTHMNVRYFEARRDGAEPVWWFGGGFDL